MKMYKETMIASGVSHKPTTKRCPEWNEGSHIHPHSFGFWKNINTAPKQSIWDCHAPFRCSQWRLCEWRI